VAPAELDPTRMCELLVGLPEVDVIGVDQPEPGELVVVIERGETRPSCSRCATPAWVKDHREVDLASRRRWRFGCCADPTGASSKPSLPADFPPRGALRRRNATHRASCSKKITSG